MPAAIYSSWEKSLRAGVWETVVPKEARKILPVGSLSIEKLIQWLLVPDVRFGVDPIAGRDALLRRSFEQALVDLERPTRSGHGPLALWPGQSEAHPDRPSPERRGKTRIPASPRPGAACPVEAMGTPSTALQTPTTSPPVHRFESLPMLATGISRSAPIRPVSPAIRTVPATATSSVPGREARTFRFFTREPRWSRSQGQ